MKSLTGRGAYVTDKNTACLTAVYNTIRTIYNIAYTKLWRSSIVHLGSSNCSLSLTAL